MGWSDMLRLACSVACVSFIIAESTLFRPVREWLLRHLPFFGHLASCGFCTACWLSLGTCAATSGADSVWIFLLDASRLAWLSGLMWAGMTALLTAAKK